MRGVSLINKTTDGYINSRIYPNAVSNPSLHLLRAPASPPPRRRLSLTNKLEAGMMDSDSVVTCSPLPPSFPGRQLAYPSVKRRRDSHVPPIIPRSSSEPSKLSVISPPSSRPLRSLPSRLDYRIPSHPAVVDKLEHPAPPPPPLPSGLPLLGLIGGQKKALFSISQSFGKVWACFH